MSDFVRLLQEAQAGDADSMRKLAWAYKEGDGTAPDIDQYFAWIKKAAEVGDADSMYNLAWAYKEGEGTASDIDQYFAWLKKAAEAGNADSMRNLAWAYKAGEGTVPDIDQYFAWIKKAAEVGDADSMNILAWAYKEGEGTVPDIDQYFAWIKKAAEVGDADSMYILAWAYKEGEGTVPDIDQYFAWIKKAAKAGNADSMYNLAWAYKKGEGTASDIDQYFAWLKKAAEAGNADSMRNLAWAYKAGEGTVPDIDQYFAWIKKAAKVGDADAMLILALAYKEGEGTASDIDQYFAWLKKSADTGNTTAMCNVARAYIEGEGTAPDIDQYFAWIKKAADAGDSDADVLHYVNSTLNEHGIRNAAILLSFTHLFVAAEEIKERHTFPDGDTSIAHFTNFQALEKMLPLKKDEPLQNANNHLRLYNVEYLNDPHEGCRVFQYMKQHEKYLDIYKTLFDTLDSESSIALLHEDLSVYVCSFTLRSDRLDLWRAYGRDGEGVCIITPLSAFEGDTEFHALGEHLKVKHKPIDKQQKGQAVGVKSASKDDEQLIIQTAPRVLYQVKYKDQEITETLDELHTHLKEIADLMLTIDTQKQDALRKCVIAIMIDIIFLYKNQEYENEQEARLVFAAQIDHPMLELDEQTPGKLFVKTDNFLFERKGSSIIIGPKVKDKKVVELNLKFRLNKHNFNNTKVEPSKVPYR